MQPGHSDSQTHLPVALHQILMPSRRCGEIYGHSFEAKAVIHSKDMRRLLQCTFLHLCKEAFADLSTMQ